MDAHKFAKAVERLVDNEMLPEGQRPHKSEEAADVKTVLLAAGYCLFSIEASLSRIAGALESIAMNTQPRS